MSEQKSHLTRRNFLRMVGMAGGSAAVHESLVALGLMRHPSVWAGPLEVDPNLGQGKSVVVLGAGLGGLSTALHLLRRGYRCTVLEAQDRVGGRSFTARAGSLGAGGKSDVVREKGGVEQTLEFDEDERLYINLGPGRIPYHHRRVIDLCQELQVALEVYVHTSDFNLHYMKDVRTPMDRAVERRRIAYDTQGYIAELLSKAVNQNALDHELLNEDKEKLLSLLRKFGDLNSRFRYTGSTRAACRELPVDVRNACNSNVLDALKPLELDVLLESQFWDPCLLSPAQGCDGSPIGFYQVQEDLWQTTSFQPIGGMDKIVKALAAEVRALAKERFGDENPILLNAAVERIALANPEQVEVTLKGGGPPQRFDFCVSNIPLTVLQNLVTPNFSPEFQAAVNRVTFSNACKVGWQANRRFWEEDQHIYGGISWAQHPITQMWYPSNDYFWKNKKGQHQGVGVLTGAYNYGSTAEAFGKLTPQERRKVAYDGGALLHPQAFDRNKTNPDVPEDKGVSIAWQNVLFQEGCSANWSRADAQQAELDYERLLLPDPDMKCRFFVVGDQVSTLPGWQEGALMSAEHVVQQISNFQGILDSKEDAGEAYERMLQQIREEIDQAPSTIDIIG